MRLKINSLSNSTVKQYEICSEAVWLDKVMHLPKEQYGVALLNGIALHAVAETLYNSKMFNMNIDLETLCKVYETTFNGLPFENIIYGKKTKEEIFDNSKQLIKLLHEDKFEEHIMEVEPSHSVKITPDLTAIVKPDLVTSDIKGSLTIWDIKSAAKSYSEDDLKRVAEQLMLYSLAYDEPVKLKVKLLLKKKKPEIKDIEINPEELGITYDDIINKFIMVKLALESGVHFKSRSWACANCGYAKICSSVNQMALSKAA